MKIKGLIVFEDVEGGVWGIRDENGVNYHPVGGIPPHLRIEGQAVTAEIEPAEVFTNVMWGRTVRLRKIEKN